MGHTGHAALGGSSEAGESPGEGAASHLGGVQGEGDESQDVQGQLGRQGLCGQIPRMTLSLNLGPVSDPPRPRVSLPENGVTDKCHPLGGAVKVE